MKLIRYMVCTVILHIAYNYIAYKMHLFHEIQKFMFNGAHEFHATTGAHTSHTHSCMHTHRDCDTCAYSHIYKHIPGQCTHDSHIDTICSALYSIKL